MTNDDFIRVHFHSGPLDLPIWKFEHLYWPPPEFIYLEGDNDLVPIDQSDIEDLHKSNSGLVMQRMTLNSDEPVRNAEYRYLEELTEEEKAT